MHRDVADRLRKDLEDHREDRYAHGAAREASGQELTDWREWRASVDRWRYMTAGGLALFLGTGAAAAIVQMLVGHGR